MDSLYSKVPPLSTILGFLFPPAKWKTVRDYIENLYVHVLGGDKFFSHVLCTL